MAWGLFGTYYYDKLQYFTLSQKKHNADKPRNIGICDILQQDKKCKRLDSIPVRVTIQIISKPRKYVVTIKIHYGNDSQNAKIQRMQNKMQPLYFYISLDLSNSLNK